MKAKVIALCGTVSLAVLVLSATATVASAQSAPGKPSSDQVTGADTTQPASPTPLPDTPADAAATGATDAQAVPAEASGGLEEVVVTARRVSENLQNVPVAVTAFSGAALEQQNSARLFDIARFTPGLVFREANSSPSSLSITLRGQTQTEILATVDPSVGTYVDGVYWARAYGLNAELLDVASAQVLKGPQGTLFGRNTTGGAILLNSNDPDADEFSARFSALYGRFDEVQASGVVNIPIVADRVAIRVAGQRSQRDGFVTNLLTGIKYNERARSNLRGKLLIKPTDNLSLIASAEYFEQAEDNAYRNLALVLNAFNDPTVTALGFPANSSPYTTSANASRNTGIQLGGSPATGSAGATTALGAAALNGIIGQFADDPDIASMNVSPRSEARTWTYNLTASLDTFFGNIKFIGGYRRVKSETTLDLDGSPYPIHTSSGFQNLRQYSGELQITGKAFNDSLDFAAGAFAFREDGSDDSRSVSIPLLSLNTSLFSGTIENDSIGVYGQGTLHFTEQFSFTGGLRYSVDDKALTTRNSNLNRSTSTLVCSITGARLTTMEEQFPDICAVRRADDFSGLSYTAGFEYKPVDDMLIYAKTSRGFRSGGQNLRAPNLAALIPFRPEVAYSHELGFKSELFDRRVRFNVAGYYTTVNDIQRSTFTTVLLNNVASNATILGNAGKARFYGLEADLAAVLFDGFTLSATAAITRPKYLRYTDAASGLDRRTERFMAVPREQFSVAADYDRELGLGRFRGRVDYSYQSRSALDPYFDADNPQNAAIVDATTEDARGLVGARASLSFADDRYEVAVFGRNLTDNRDPVVGLVVAPLGYVNNARRDPRTFGVQFSARLGQ